MMFRKPILLSLALAAACSDRDAQRAADSAALAADLALVTQQTATPRFEDTALTSASTPRPAAPARAQTRPTTTLRRVPTDPPRPIARAEPVETPATQPAAARFRGFGAGTAFTLATKSPICTTHLPGDKIVATLTEPVTGENGAYMPAGTTVVLEVASVTPGETPESAQISLRVRSIVINDESVNAEADVAIASALERHEVARNPNADRKKVVGGAIAGAIIGQIMGRNTKSTVIGAAAGAAAGTAAAAASRKYEACLPAGGSVRVTTTRPIALSA